MNPALAEEIAPPSGTVASKRATVLLLMSQAKPAEVEVLSRAALTAEPMDFNAASSLGLIYYVKGRRNDAIKLFALVGGASLREKNSHAMLLQDALDRNDGKAAVREAEIVLRQNRSLEATALKVLTLMVDRGMVIQSLADRLATGVPWRGQLMRHIGTDGQNAKHEAELFRAMQARGSGPSGEELDLWLLRQAGARPASEIANLWREFDTKPLAVEDRFLRAGTMDISPVPRPFNWNFYTSDDGYAERDASPDRTSATSGGQAMFVEFRGSANLAMARQWLVLEPGRYRLGAQALSPFEITQPHISLRLHCLEGDSTLVAITPKPGRADTWQSLANDFTVPAGCSVQSLDIVGQGIPDSGYEQLYLDDFSITRVAASSPPRAN
jgi:hypothetical protein